VTPPFNACDYLLDRHIREGRGDGLALTGVAGEVGSVRAVCETYGTQVLGITPEDRCLSAAKAFFTQHVPAPEGKAPANPAGQADKVAL
jgi:hypothetical protein